MVKKGTEALFVEKSVAAGAEVRDAADKAAALEDIGRILAAEKIGGPVVCAGDLFDAACGAGFSVVRPETPEDWLRVAASVVRADYGIAETGTLVRLKSAAFENNAWTLPPLCFCLVDGEAIVDVPEDLASVLKACFDEDGNEPRGAFFVTGPSRTADIECLLTLGVHGPSRVVVYLLGFRGAQGRSRSKPSEGRAGTDPRLKVEESETRSRSGRDSPGHGRVLRRDLPEPNERKPNVMIRSVDDLE